MPSGFLFNPLNSFIPVSGKDALQDANEKELQGINRSPLADEVEASCDSQGSNYKSQLPVADRSLEDNLSENNDAEIVSQPTRRIFKDYWSHSGGAALFLSPQHFPISLTTRDVMVNNRTSSHADSENVGESIAQDQKIRTHPSITAGLPDSIRDARKYCASSYSDVKPMPHDESDKQYCYNLQRVSYCPLPPRHRSCSIDRANISVPKPCKTTTYRRQSYTPTSVSQSFALHDHPSASSISSAHSSDQSHASSDTKTLVSILRKPRCHHRRTSSGSISNQENQQLWAEGTAKTMKSGEESNSEAVTDRRIHNGVGVDSNGDTSLTRCKSYPSSPVVCQSSIKPRPHVSIFKRPDTVKLPWKLEYSELPSWLTATSLSNKNVGDTSFDSSDGSRQDSKGHHPSSSWDTNQKNQLEDQWTPRVKWDPRIGVVEYVEDEFRSDGPTESSSSCLEDKRLSHERNEAATSKWYSADEMNQFKLDALQQAQLMLLAAPRSRIKNHLCSTNQIQQRRGVPNYNNPLKNNNVTMAHIKTVNNSKIPKPRGTIPTRASFANPVLHYTPEDSVMMEGSEELDLLLKTNIRSVLIIDPNDSLRTLFQKAFQYLFPAAKILTTGNSENALKLIEAAKLMDINTASNDQADEHFIVSTKVSSNGFDIIVVEERLGAISKRQESFDFDEDALQSTVSEDDTATSCLQQPAGEDQEQDRRNCDRPKIAMSGSELLCHITKEEKELAHLRPSLYIGVSVYLSTDGPRLLQSGADLIWGKPPPRTDKFLRNQLVTTLLEKRGKSVLICDLS